MGTKRRSRRTPPPCGPYQLVSRDYEALHAVGRMRIATSKQLVTAGFFGHPSAASRRIAKLAALGFAGVHCPEMNGPNCVTLTVRGLALLVGRGAAPNELHVARGVVHRDRHLEAINDFRVGLVRAARARNELTLDLFLADHDLRRALGRAARHAAYVPDALVRLRLPAGRELRLAVELDLGSEWSAHLASKAHATLELARAQAPLYGLASPWRPLVLAPTAARLRAIARVFDETGAGALWIGALIAEATARPFDAVFALASELAAATPGAPLPLTRRLVPAREGA